METSAGKFKVSEIRRTDSKDETIELVYFYSPETKSVVKLTGELFSATPGKFSFAHYEMELIKYGRHIPSVNVGAQ